RRCRAIRRCLAAGRPRVAPAAAAAACAGIQRHHAGADAGADIGRLHAAGDAARRRMMNTRAANTASSSALSLPALLPPMLLWMVLALLPLGRVAELPLLVGAIWGVVLVLRERAAVLALPGVRLALALFACYWLPALLSAFDAVAAEKTWTQVAAQLRFAPFAVFAVTCIRSPAQWQWLLRASALLLAVWV